MDEVPIGFSDSETESNIQEYIQEIAQESTENPSEVTEYKEDLIAIVRRGDEFPLDTVIDCIRVLTTIEQQDGHSISEFDPIFAELINSDSDLDKDIVSELVTNIGFVVQNNPTEFPKTSNAIYEVVGELDSDGDERGVQCLTIVYADSPETLGVEEQEIIDRFEEACEKSVFVADTTVNKAKNILGYEDDE